MYEKWVLNSKLADNIGCPRIHEPDPDKEQALNLKSVTEETNDSRESLSSVILESFTHKMSTDAKEKVMLDFKAKRSTSLVATSVVEVGVNVPDTTVIVIEGRTVQPLTTPSASGRVLQARIKHITTSFADHKSGKTIDRLNALVSAQTVSSSPEFDLTQRGAGELYGRKQWGISDLAMEGIKNIKMVETARREAHDLWHSIQLWISIRFSRTFRKIGKRDSF